MNRADVIKLIAHQLKQEVEQVKVDTAEAAKAARAAFRQAVVDQVFVSCEIMVKSLLTLTGGCPGRVVVDVKYELFDDELNEPAEQCVAIVRDGEEYDCTFRFRVPVEIRSTVERMRNVWIAAKRAQITAESAGVRMCDVRTEAWARVVGEVLDSENGAEAQAALRELRKRIKASGWDKLAEKLKAVLS